MASTIDFSPDLAPAAPLQMTLPAAPTGTDVIQVTYDTIYNWDYGVHRVDLRNLYEKSKDAMWNARTQLPWETSVDPESETVPDQMSPIFGTPLWDKLDKKTELPKLRRLSSAWMLSNFLHGEQGALLATAQLVGAVPGTDAKFYASTQVMDEARHVEAYDRYLRDKIGVTFPISPYLRTLLDEILRETRWDMKYLGMQIMVEGLALAAFGFIQQLSSEPLLKQLVHMVMQDEARHVAFGRLALRDYYPELSDAERREREDFVIEGSYHLRDRFNSPEMWEQLGFDVKEVLKEVDGAEGQIRFRKRLFSRIVPTVRDIGLWSERVQKAYTDMGGIQYAATNAQEMLDNDARIAQDFDRRMREGFAKQP